MAHLRSIFLAFAGKHIALRCLVVVGRSSVVVGVREGIAERHAVRTHVLTRLAGDHFLAFVQYNHTQPVNNGVVQRSDTVGIDLGTARGQEDAVGAARQGVLQADGSSGVDVPIYRLVHGIRCRLCGCRVREAHQQALALQGQLRDDGLQNVVLRVGKGVRNHRTHHHFLTGHQIERTAVGTYAAGMHVYRARLDGRLACLVERVVDDGYRLGLTRQLTHRSAYEHVGIRTDASLVFLARCADSFARGELVGVFVTPRPFVYDRHGEGELLAIGEVGAVVRTCSFGCGNGTDIVGHVQSPGGCQVHTGFPVVTLVVGIGIGGTVLYPCRTAVAARVAHDIQQGDTGFGGGQLVALCYIAQHIGAEGVGLHRVTLVFQCNAHG